jgi:Protein of unknown function (DUF3830)
MSQIVPSVRVTIGGESFEALLRYDLAPRSCARLEGLMPYQGQLVHARWSGESCWSPMAAVWHSGPPLPPENATAYPSPGQVLLFGGALSEPELLVPYGSSCFASKAGLLAGNPVLTIEDRLNRLAELGRQILWNGAVDLRIERIEARSNITNERGRPQPFPEQELTLRSTGDMTNDGH